MKKLLGIALLLVVCALPASAQVDPGQWEIGFRPAWITAATNDRGLESGYGLNFDVTYFFTERWGLEFNYQHANFPTDIVGFPGQPSAEQDSVRVSGIYNLKTDMQLLPYMRFGVGWAQIQADEIAPNETDSTHEILLGVGMKRYFENHNIFWRAEILGVAGEEPDQIFGQQGNNYVDYEVSFGIGWALAGDPCRWKRGDRDGDGVMDCNDKCPNTPPVPCKDIDANGCYVERDSDGDGVTDCNDKCPNTPPKSCAGIDENGCYVHRDGDGDGVNDCDDQCPNTKPENRSKVDAQGCFRAAACHDKIVIDETIMKFRVDSWQIPGAGKGILDKVAEELLTCRTLKVEISGHTSHTGGRKWNEKLSRKRAESVMEYLKSKGVPADQMYAVGYAWDKPFEAGQGVENPKNRRVEVENNGN